MSKEMKKLFCDMKLETGLVELKETGQTYLIDSERIGFNELEIRNLNVSLQFSFELQYL